MGITIAASLFLSIAASASNHSQESISDTQMLAMGHRQWIAKTIQNHPDNLDEISNGEYRFALALGKRNAQRIERDPNRDKLTKLQMWVSNLTKGAARVGDYAHVNEAQRFLNNRKANSLANITIDGFLSQSPPPKLLTQAEVWETFRKGREFHNANDAKIADYERQGGYSVKQLKLEYNSLGFFADKLLKEIASAPISQRQHALFHCNQMFQLSMGQNPIPD